MFNFIRDMVDLAKGVTSDFQDLVSDSQKIIVETKNEMKEELHRSNPGISNTVDKTDNFIKTAKNFYDQTSKYGPLTNQLIPSTKIGRLENVAETFEDIPNASHLKVDRLGYSHHAIYLGDNQVIHYQEGRVKIDSLQNFEKGGQTLIVPSIAIYDSNQIINRAYSRLGENSYNLIFNNCEHFALWCRNGNK